MAAAMDVSPPAGRGSTIGEVVAKRDVCEYGLLPVQSLFPRLDSPSAVLALARRLLELSKPSPGHAHNYAVSVNDAAAVLGLCSSTTQIILDTLEAVSPEGAVLRDPGSGQPTAILAHALVLFLFIQLHSRQGTLANATEVWPSLRDLECHEAPLSPTRASSPRSRGAKKGKHQQNRKWFQEQLQHHQQHLAAYPSFVRRHIRQLLMLVLNSPPARFEIAAGAAITAAEFDRLGMLLRPVDSAKAGRPLSQLITDLGNKTSAPLAVVEQWLLANTAEAEEDAMSPEAARHVKGGGIGSGTIKQGEGVVDLEGIVKGTVVRGEDLCPGGELRVADCHDVVIYALTPLRTASIFGCSDATIVLGAVGEVVRLERCERLQLITVAKRVTISTCHDCTLFLGVNRPPCLIGDNRFIQLAPYCTQYDALPGHIAAAGLTPGRNMWDQPITVARDTRTHAPDSPRGPGFPNDRVNRSSWSLLPPHKLLPFVIPFKGSTGALGGGGASNPVTPVQAASSAVPNPFPLPPMYETALSTKVRGVAELRAAVKSAVLEEPRKRELQAVIQAHFKEWLVASGNMRQIYDLARLEREEG